jgi:hypothetical protein
MAQYRKKPVVIEALQFTEETKNQVYYWAKEKQQNVYHAWSEGEKPAPILMIPTLEGEMTCSIGDFVIQGIQGELYPCKPDIFEKTYDLVE